VVKDDAEAVGEPAPHDRLVAQDGIENGKRAEVPYFGRAGIGRCRDSGRHRAYIVGQALEEVIASKLARDA